MENVDSLTPQETTNNKTKFTDSQYFKTLKKFNDFKGRTGRKEYWFFILINTIISVLLSFLWNPLAIIFQMLVFIPNLAASIRRLHDVNKEAWYILIPGYNLFLLLSKETDNKETNKYASPVADIQLRIEILFVLTFILLIFSLLKFILVQGQIKENSGRENLVSITSNNNENNSRAEIEALNEASLQEVEQAQTLEEVIQAYKNARTGSEASLQGAMKWISLCQTSQEIKEASSNFAENSDAKVAALKKWKEISQQEISQAQTIEAAKLIYENAPNDDDLKNTIYNKWNELCLQQVDQLKSASEAKKAYNNSPAGSQSRTKILEKWKELINQGIDQAQNFQDLKTLYENIPEDDTLKNTLLTKWVSFCQATYDTKEIYSYTTNRDTQGLILTKWKELANQEIEQAENFQEISFLYDNLPSDTKITSAAILKWISLSQTYLEAKEIYSRVSSDYSKEKESALEKWNTLALQEVEQSQTLDAVKEIYNNTPENSSSRSTALEKIKELN